MDSQIITTARKINSYDERLSFMPKYFGHYWLVVENFTYQWMRKLSPKKETSYLMHALDKNEAHYDGGEWDFYELSNGGYFIAPNSREYYRITVNGNYFDGLLSAEATGIVVNLFVLCQLAESNYSLADKCCDYYHKLFDYAREHAEYSQIRAAID